jgi:hypothetical protein
MPWIASAVPAFADLMKINDWYNRRDQTRRLQRRDDMIAFRIEVAGDVVRDLTRGVAQAHTGIKRR